MPRDAVSRTANVEGTWKIFPFVSSLLNLYYLFHNDSKAYNIYDSRSSVDASNYEIACYIELAEAREID